MLTISKFQGATSLGDAAAAAWFPHIAEAMSAFDINTPFRQAHFLAQTGHESAGFTKTEEGLNYSESALNAMFSKRITPAQAKAYGRNISHPASQPAIANIIYAGRNGNGDIASGDGYRYRGRGLIQVTGKRNYAALVDVLGADIVANPDLLTGYRMAARSAAAWWKMHGLNEIADRDDLTRITRIINGGVNGMDDRLRRLRAAKAALCT